MTKEEMTLWRAIKETTDAFVGVIVRCILYLPYLIAFYTIPLLIIAAPLLLNGITEKTFVQSLLLSPIAVLVLAFELVVAWKMDWL